MIIIPAIDIMNGKCVRLAKGDYAQQTIYNKKPVEVAKHFADAGFQRLHIVDLDGARYGRLVNTNVLEQIASATNSIIDFGGGIKNINDVQAVLNAGASIVTIGSLAVNNPKLLEAWVQEFGANRFLIGADVLEEKIKISGWQEETGTDIFDFVAAMLRIGLTNIFCTDISKDGMMMGPSVELYYRIMERFPAVNLVASGGVSHIDDVAKLQESGCTGVIIGKAIYENRITLEQLKTYNL